MELIDLLKDVKTTESCGNQHKEIAAICTDSRNCSEGSMFIAVKGAEADGHNYIGSAIGNGATAIVCTEIPESIEEQISNAGKSRNDITFIKVQDDRSAAALVARNFYRDPSRNLRLVGVTGTNGKTSIATLLYNLFTKLGYCCGLLSTIANYVGEKRYETQNTTPGPVELNRLLAEMVDAGCEFCFMEVSSHALDQQRTEGLHFTGAVFTNLTHDHLDYHKSFANYLKCKKSLFDTLAPEAFALVNTDDRNGNVMVQNCRASINSYACRNEATFKTRIIEKTIEGMLLKINGKEVWCRFIGQHNAYNLTAVYGVAVLLGAKEDETILAMSQLTSVAGRLEYFKGANDVIAAVDYAHTPDALENVLKTLKELEPAGGICCVFGCGGNRDKTKRPEMGAIAGKYAQRIIVTSDNPRFEDPVEIIKEIREGMDIKARAKSLFITDREEAIRTAILTAQPGSIILVAGKGHEDYQIINGVKHHFDDKEIIQETFAQQMA